MTSDPRPGAVELTRASGALATEATRRMEATLPWYRELGPEERSWVSLVAQAGIAAFIDWYGAPVRGPALTADVFDAAPRELARVISLEQTVDLVRATIDVVESAIEELVAADDSRSELRLAALRYSREVAFSAAEVYARAAEARGAWDARLEALVVDALLRGEVDEDLLGRVGALGWAGRGTVFVLAGPAPLGDPQSALDALRRAATHHGLDLLSGVHGTTLLAVVGGSDPTRGARLLAPHFGPGPVVASAGATALAQVPRAARSALSGLSAAWGWPDAPRPVHADELLPERALAGDTDAVTALVQQVHRTLLDDAALYDTASTYLERTGSLEATARALFIHPNTVRYRLRRIADLTGLSPSEARGAFTLRVGLVLGRLSSDELDLDL